MAQDQEHVNNEDPRHMMNETIWYAAKETVKIKQVKILLLLKNT